MVSNRQFPAPAEIAEIGQKIYDERYRAEYENKYTGKYVAINIRSGEAALGDTPEAALELARKQAADGMFHLMRVGFPSVYSGSAQVGYGRKDWLFGR